jgi:hypothetical protein
LFLAAPSKREHDHGDKHLAGECLPRCIDGRKSAGAAGGCSAGKRPANPFREKQTSMKTSSALRMVLLLAACTLPWVPAAALRAAPKPGKWHDRLTAAVDEARATGKPLMVVFRCVR